MDYNKDRRSAKDKALLADKPRQSNEKIELNVESITPDQINLIFKRLSLDLSYVDENDRVQFYNRGEEQIFPRSPRVIGRLVKYCHPLKSVNIVLRILEEFKNGKKDSAEFWFKMGEKFLYIQYFAVRDENKKYKGVLEVTQGISHIRELEGQQKLLNWD